MLRTAYFWLATVLASSPFLAGAETLELYIDADYSINTDAAVSIELGVRTALDQAGNRLAGTDVAVVPMDHQGSAKRSLRTMKRFADSDNALAVIGGMHSPPYLVNQSYINSNEVLMLLPWSAAGPITRVPPGDANWMFRLSVDDFQSGEFLVDAAVGRAGCERVALALLDTGWGRANLKTLSAALEARGLAPATVEFFPVTVGDASAGTLAQNVQRSGADCAIMLANWDNGATVTVALAKRNPELRVFSHWGIMGGRYADLVPHETRSRLQIEVLQTCGLRRERESSPVLQEALSLAAPEVESLADLPAPTGFVHGYDLALILIAAAEQAAQTPAWNGDIRDRRRALHEALEALAKPVARHSGELCTTLWRLFGRSDGCP